jgi:hypothetical protein
MVCAAEAGVELELPIGDVLPTEDIGSGVNWPLGDRVDPDQDFLIDTSGETADAKDPFDDFEEDDFDDDFDDDFEEDWEDDLTEDDEFPDTFGGEDEADEEEIGEPAGDDGGESPFADDPDFDDA